MRLQPPRHKVPFAELGVDVPYMHIVSSTPRSEDVKGILAELIPLYITGTMKLTGVLELEEGDAEVTVRF